MSFVKKLKAHEFNLFKGNKPLLGRLDIELTERCNNNCIHCCINKSEFDSDALTKEMSTDFVKEILTEAERIGCLSVRFTGGEPLLRNDFQDLYLFARRLGMKVILFTNARLITEKLAEMFVKYPLGHAIEVSVYGMRTESYDSVVRQDGAYTEFHEGVSLLLKHKVPFIVKGPKFKFLKEEQDEFITWAESIPSMDKKPGYSMNFDLRHRRDDPEKNAIIKKLRLTPEETVSILTNNPLYLKSMGEFCSNFIGPPGDKLFKCGAGKSICIDSYGNAQLCLPLRCPDNLVSLHKVSLKIALQESFKGMQEIKAKNPEYLRRCAICFLNGLCEQCPAKSWVEHGTLDTPVEYLCDVAHAQARFLGLISDDENAWEVNDWKVRVKRFVAIHGPAI